MEELRSDKFTEPLACSTDSYLSFFWFTGQQNCSGLLRTVAVSKQHNTTEKIIANEIRTLYRWVRASKIEFNNRHTRCDLFSLLYFCRQLYMFRVLTTIMRSSYNCNYSFWYWLTGSITIRSRCWVGTDSCVSYGRCSFVITNEQLPYVPGDGCQHPKHIELPTEI